MISIYNPNIKDYIKSAIDAIESGWISNHGIYIKKATDKLKEILKVKNIILMANGTCATHCLFISLKYKYPNISKIYIPNNCYIAAWNSLFNEYSKNIVEVIKMDIDTWNINTNEDYIKSLEENSAMLIVHNLGNIINVPRLKKIRPDIIFIEDNCEGLFGSYENIKTGSSDSVLCSSVSFYGNKIITTGEGGAFLTNDDDLYNYINKVYSQGMSNIRYLHDTHAYNYRMTNIQAAFLFDQLNDLDNILLKKKIVFDNYKRLLSKNSKIKLFKEEDGTNSSCWIFSIRIIDNKFLIDETFNFFKERNIDTRPFFYPINKHDHLNDINFDDEIPYILNKEILMIPSSPDITNEEQEIVVNIINQFTFLLETNYKIIEVNEDNKNLLAEFIKDIKSDTFRYFSKRDENIIKNHLLTILLIDNVNNKIFGYAHIDQEILENGEIKYWFGICLYNQYHNKGIGNKLMNYVLNHYKVKYLNEIYLTVDNINIAGEKIYLRNGFIEINSNESYKTMKRVFIS